MFYIKFDKTNIVLLAIAGFLGVWSIFVPAPAGGFFPLVIAVVLIAYVRSIYFVSGKKVALLMSLIFLIVPIVLYLFYYALTATTLMATMIDTWLPRILISLAVLFGIGLFYTLVRIGIATVSPETSNNIEIMFISRAAKRFFDFLLKKGYRIVDVQYVAHHYGGWHVRLESPDQEISIILDREQGSILSFGREIKQDDWQVYLEAMIYHLTHGQVFIDPQDLYEYSMKRRFQIVADLLMTYHDRLVSYKHEKPLELKKQLSDIQSKYFLALSQKREQARKQ